jgi:gluconokinase
MTSIVVMGVAGCGKSSLGDAVARCLGWPLIEGDHFHPPASVDKMRAGVPLTDADRAGWLDALGAELQRHPAGAVLTCSALRRAYRDRLRAATPTLRFAHLALGAHEAHRRVSERAGGHYFGPDLVRSQFETLEPPVDEADVITLDATLPLDVLRAKVVGWCTESPT